ncbi:NUDIX hydrolase [Falsibacillus albus]|uniref:CoA pyrophosphatase n=1 Tax=Falsibacillus albus TaxID=2478915 RepID=A0A3L7JLZ7_9BACI|nr:CoA pyrophosphatase [Falsibacillus albus]RLQ91109.1 CoA pyrophosphatase [Falsibacillus albus]
MDELENIVEHLNNRPPSILGNDKFHKFAILLPLVKKDGEYHILFEVRSHDMRRQPGEICFPGGRIEPGDRDARSAAIRETSEELGISTEEIVNVSPLDYMVSPFGTMIFPFAGMISKVESIKPNPSEVAEVFTVPVSFFQKSKPDVYDVHFRIEPDVDFPFDMIIGGENYNWQSRKMEEYFYYYEERVIWGLTARILAHFIEIIGEIKD